MSLEDGASDDLEGFRKTLDGLKPQQLRDQFPSEANSHRGMLQRARKDPSLSVDPRWRTFATFLGDMGPMPHQGWSLDRIDTHRREYGPGLCRWADPKTQSENRANTRWVEVNGERITAAELARRAERPASSVYAALDAGQPAEAILDRLDHAEYRPLGLAGDQAYEDWRRAYRKWLNEKVHHTKRALAPPAVYDLIKSSLDAALADAELERRGYFELTPDENDRASELLASDAGQMRWTIAPARAEHALSSLRRSHPGLAATITRPNGGYALLTYCLWLDFLAKPRE